MPLDPACAAIIEFRAQQGRPSYADPTIVEQLRATAERTRMLQKPPQEVASVVDTTYGSSPEQALRIYTPRGASAPYPVVVHFHGGGFVSASLDLIDEPSRALANDVGALVVSATHRKAPESRFPAAHDDAVAAVQWVAEHISDHGGDPQRLAVMGDSAGANLAASSTVRARDAGRPLVRALVMLYPMISPNVDTASRTEYAEGYILDGAALEFYGAQYASRPEDFEDPRWDLDRTPSLAGLPPTLVLTNEYDMFRDEAEDFARRLAAEGVDVTAQRFDGLVHIVYWMSAAVPKQAEMHAAVVEFLRTHLA